MEKMIVAGMGEVLWDVFPDRREAGGAPANFAYHMSRFGFDSRVVSAVGDDEPGRAILDVFRSKKLSFEIETVGYPTGTVYVALDGAGIPRYDITRDVAWDYIPFTPALARLALQTRAVSFGSLAQRSPVSRHTIGRFLDTMPDEEGRYKIFDVNLRGDFYDRGVLETGLKKCNVLKINDEEIIVVSEMFGLPADFDAACRRLLTVFGLKAVILTCGVAGSYVYTPRETSFLGTPEVEVADTVGAGDSFTAAFCAAMLKGKPVREAHRLAVDVSAFVCSSHGAMPGLPDTLCARL